MLYVFIVQLVIIIGISTYLATHTISNSTNSLIYEKVSNLFDKEEFIAKTTNLIYKDANLSSDPSPSDIKDNIRTILGSNYDFSNNFGNDYIIYYEVGKDVKLCSSFNDEKVKNIYLKHYKGRKYGISPYIKSGELCHKYPIQIFQ